MQINWNINIYYNQLNKKFHPLTFNEMQGLHTEERGTLDGLVSAEDPEWHTQQRRCLTASETQAHS